MDSELGTAKAAPLPKRLSENTIRLENDHHFKSTGGQCLHADDTNLRIGVVHITTGKSPKIFCSSVVGRRDPVNKWVRKGSLDGALCIMLSVAEF
jgi:hypothetical protein